MAMDWEDRRRAARRAYGYDRDQYAAHRDPGPVRPDRMNEERHPARMYDDDDSRYRANRYDRGYPDDYAGDPDDDPGRGHV